MDELPLTGLAFAVQRLQGGLAMHIVQTPIHTPDQPMKGMTLRFAAPAAGIRHGFLLDHGDAFP
jgi:hypothetical protein